MKQYNSLSNRISLHKGFGPDHTRNLKPWFEPIPWMVRNNFREESIAGVYLWLTVASKVGLTITHDPAACSVQSPSEKQSTKQHWAFPWKEGNPKKVKGQGICLSLPLKIAIGSHNKSWFIKSTDESIKLLIAWWSVTWLEASLVQINC